MVNGIFSPECKAAKGCHKPPPLPKMFTPVRSLLCSIIAKGLKGEEKMGGIGVE